MNEFINADINAQTNDAEQDSASSHTLDARNLLCPMPVIRTQNTIAGLAAGDVLKVICTDPGVKNDIPAWCRINGHQVLHIDEQDREIVIQIRVSEA